VSALRTMDYDMRDSVYPALSESKSRCEYKKTLLLLRSQTEGDY
jgi:hypothetical protein